MEPQDAIDLGRQAVVQVLTIGAPVLVSALVVGLLIGLLQALTQIQEQTISFVPKITVMILVLGYTLPWLITRMVQYSHDLISGIPDRL